MSARVLVVEDNADLAFGLQRNLEFEGFEVAVAEDGEAARERLERERWDLVVLDLMLPGVDGLTLLGRMRRSGDRTPVLVLTAKGEELDKVRGLRSGADDYLTKPFGVLELIARCEALLRRAPSGPAERDRVQRFGGVVVDRAARAVRKEDGPVPLTPREYDLLVALLDRRGAAVSRQELLGEVWGHKAAVATRTVDTHVAELRRKLEDEPSRPRHILTVRKFGYRLETDEAERRRG